MKKKLLFLVLLTSIFSVNNLSFAQNDENNKYEIVQDVKQSEAVKNVEAKDIEVPNVTVSKESNPSLKKTEFMEPDSLIPLGNSTSEFVYKKEDKTGYVNHETQIGFITSYDEISLLGSFLKIKNDGKFGLMDKQGNLILKPQFKRINLCHSGENEYFEAKINGKYRIYNTEGKLISLNEMLSITDNPAILLVNDLKSEFKSFINSFKTEKKPESVEIVVPQTNIVEVKNNIENVDEAVVDTVLKNESEVIDIVEKPQIIQKKRFTEKVKDKLTKQANKVEKMADNNAIIVDGKLYYIVMDNNKIGIKDKDGNIIIPAKYDTCDVKQLDSLFTQSVFVLSGENGYSVYNKKGEILVEPVYNKLNIYNHGNVYNFSITENLVGVLSKNGKVVGNFDLTPPEYKYTSVKNKNTDKKVVDLVKILLNISK